MTINDDAGNEIAVNPRTLSRPEFGAPRLPYLDQDFADLGGPVPKDPVASDLSTSTIGLGPWPRASKKSANAYQSMGLPGSDMIDLADQVLKEMDYIQHPLNGEVIVAPRGASESKLNDKEVEELPSSTPPTIDCIQSPSGQPASLPMKRAGLLQEKATETPSCSDTIGGHSSTDNEGLHQVTSGEGEGWHQLEQAVTESSHEQRRRLIQILQRPGGTSVPLGNDSGGQEDGVVGANPEDQAWYLLEQAVAEASPEQRDRVMHVIQRSFQNTAITTLHGMAHPESGALNTALDHVERRGNSLQIVRSRPEKKEHGEEPVLAAGNSVQVLRSGLGKDSRSCSPTMLYRTCVQRDKDT